MRPIFITGAHKSGTSFLRSLLDGHPELFVIPFESHFLSNYGVEPIYPLRNVKQINFNSKDNFLLRTKDSINDYVENTSEFTDSTTLSLNKELLFKYLDEINTKDSIKDLYLQFCDSIYKSIYNKKLKNLRIVEKSVENAELAWMYNHLFPDSFFLHIIRNPYANLVSLRKFKSKGKRYPSIIESLLSLYINYKFLDINQKMINNYLVIRYEDLLFAPSENMKKISSFLGIQYNENLLKTTSLSQPWKSNSMYGNQSQEISKTNFMKWEKEIQPLEIYYINNLFKEYILKNNYKPLESRFFLKPAPKENIKTYFRNRLFKLYLNNFV